MKERKRWARIVALVGAAIWLGLAATVPAGASPKLSFFVGGIVAAFFTIIVLELTE